MTSYSCLGMLWEAREPRSRRARESWQTATTTEASRLLSITELPAHLRDQAKRPVPRRRALLAERDALPAELLELLACPHLGQGPVHHVANLALVGDLDQAARQDPAVRLDQRIVIRNSAGLADRVHIRPVDAPGIVGVGILRGEEAGQDLSGI